MSNHTEHPRDMLPKPPVVFAFVLAIFAMWLVFLFLPATNPEFETISYSKFRSRLVAGDVKSVEISPTEIRGVVHDQSQDNIRAVLPPVDNQDLLPLLEKLDIEVKARVPSGGGGALTWILPWLLIIGFYFWIVRRSAAHFPGPTSGMADLFGGSYLKPAAKKASVKFVDVAGQDAAKKDVEELVEFLRDYERFERVGAEVPHGVLLMGPPGTGKTLLAKALAGEADVPFYSTTGSEFIEVYVGVGAGRVRRLFETARKNAPAVVFIDELDSIGRTRGTGLGGGHDEREQTLNQILAELDGFSGKDAVVVLAATNRPDVLDPALLRPGRFDRHVTLNLPDRAARRAILDIHAKGRPLGPDADLNTIAAATPGFSGADLRNLLNEAAISAARRSGNRISASDLEDAKDRIMMGTVRTLAIQPQEKHRLAVHEAGHTAVAFYSESADPVFKVTIIPRGQALGGTHMLPAEERHTMEEDYLRTQLVVLLAGRSAEKLFLGDASSGADDDIRRATELARKMVARWGMSDALGPIDLRSSDDHPFLGQSLSHPRAHSEETAGKVDAEVMALLQECEAEATKIISTHRKRVEALIGSLETQETLDETEIANLLRPGEAVANLPSAGAQQT